MKVVDATDVEPVAYTSRKGSSDIRVLLEGEAGAVDNYLLSLQDIDESFSTPRHRHNFDQFRIALEEPYNIGPKLDLLPGEIAYFPEGTHYGPQNGTTGTLVLTLQFAGASRSRYLNFGELIEGHHILANEGRFHDGVYTHPDGRNQDSHEAIWERMVGEAIRYPAPRYPQPIKIRPDDFDWVPGEHGIDRKHLGTFTERRASISMIHLDDSAPCSVGSGDQRSILFVRKGSVLHGDSTYPRYSALLLERQESCDLIARGDTTLIEMILPDLRDGAPPRSA